MDISGETQRDLTHNILKTRLDQNGVPIPRSHNAQLRGDADILNDAKKEGYCGSCYGGHVPESGCCNTCDDVREAYVARGWSFSTPESIDQVREFATGLFEYKEHVVNQITKSSVGMRVGQRNSRNSPTKVATSRGACA